MEHAHGEIESSLSKIQNTTKSLTCSWVPPSVEFIEKKSKIIQTNNNTMNTKLLELAKGFGQKLRALEKLTSGDTFLDAEIDTLWHIIVESYGINPKDPKSDAAFGVVGDYVFGKISLEKTNKLLKKQNDRR